MNNLEYKINNKIRKKNPNTEKGNLFNKTEAQKSKENELI